VRFQTQALVAALLLGATAANAAPEQGPAPQKGAHQPVVVNPAWVRTPDAEQLAHVFPPAAIAASVAGKTRLKCQVRVDGSLDGCVLLSESPAGWGFGEAALKLVPYFQMRPKTVDGVPVGGVSVTIPINFAMDDTPPPTPSDPPPTIAEAQARDPEALALARRIAELTEGQDPMTGAVTTAYHAWVYQLFDRQNPARSTSFVEAFRASLDDFTAERRDRVAAALVITFSREDLKDIKAFLETHAGAAFANEFPLAMNRSLGRSDELLHAFVDAWQARYCAKVACDDHDLNGFTTLRTQFVVPPSAPK
jgi:TonB family protein